MFELIVLTLTLAISGNIIAIVARSVVGEYVVLASAAIALYLALAL